MEQFGKWVILVVCLCLWTSDSLHAQESSLLDSLLRADTSTILRKVVNNPEKYRLQIIYSQLDFSKNKTTLTDYGFHIRPLEYFYPASLVKLPAAALALEKLNNMKLDKVDRTTSLITNPLYSGWPVSAEYPSPSIEQNILHMMVVSDNFAYNRIYDFLGQEYMHLRMFQKGYSNARFIQRMSSATLEENRSTGPFKFVDTSNTVLYEEEQIKTNKLFTNPCPNPKVGKAYMAGRKKVNEPKDFSENNFLPLSDAHKILVSILYPDFIQPSSRFELTEDDRLFLKKSMGMYPREAGIPLWQNDSLYYDYFRKMIYVGEDKGRADTTIRIFNKIGMAYGFMSDAVYFVDYENKVEFFLSAILYVNENEVLNDGKYEYSTVGYPFMKALGKCIYKYECSRPSTCRNTMLQKEKQ